VFALACAGNNEEIFYFIPFRSYLVVPHDPSPIDCATPPGFVMLSCPVCTSSCRWGFDATVHRICAVFFLSFILVVSADYFCYREISGATSSVPLGR
jgi:hypothetical protein